MKTIYLLYYTVDFFNTHGFLFGATSSEVTRDAWCDADPLHWTEETTYYG